MVVEPVNRRYQRRPVVAVHRMSISYTTSLSFALESTRSDIAVTQAPPLMAINVTKDHQ